MVLLSLVLAPAAAVGGPAAQDGPEPPAGREAPPPCGRPDDSGAVTLGHGPHGESAEPAEPADGPIEFAATLEADRTYRAEVRCLDGRLWPLRPLFVPYHHSAGITWTNLDDFAELRPETLGTSRRRIVFVVREVEVTFFATQRRWSDHYECEILEVEPAPTGAEPPSTSD